MPPKNTRDYLSMSKCPATPRSIFPADTQFDEGISLNGEGCARPEITISLLKLPLESFLHGVQKVRAYGAAYEASRLLRHNCESLTPAVVW
jgi:hypothetical protein